MNWLENIFGKSKKRIYLDYAAAAPMLLPARQEMEKYLGENFYNPNSIYAEGVQARLALDDYRERIARVVRVSKESIIFTSGGTEANALAVRGVGPGKVIVEEGSHPSVSEAVLKPTSPKIVLVSSVVPDNKLGRSIRLERRKRSSEYPLLHIDASQTAGYHNISLEALSCDLLTLDAAKIGGPKGVGVLVVRRGVKLDLPPRGTPALPLIAGFCVALEVAERDREKEFKRLKSMSEEFARIIKSTLPEAEIKIDEPNIVNVSVPGVLPEFLVLSLDKHGVMASAGPACNFHKPEPPDTPVRFSFGRSTTPAEAKEAAEIFCRTVQNMVK